MNDSSYQSVRDALARQLGTDPGSFRMQQHLERDLGLSAFDRDMIALWLEDMEGVQIATELLQPVQTVGQLVRLLRGLKNASEADERAERGQSLWRFIGALPRRRLRWQRTPTSAPSRQ